MADQRALPVAFWTPLPPQRTGIADYSYELLAALSHITEVVAIVDDTAVTGSRVPNGVQIMGASEHCNKAFRTNVFQVGNHFAFHGYMFAPMLSLSGVLVLHDLSLYDYFWAMCQGGGSGAMAEELAYDSQGNLTETEIAELVMGAPNVERMRAPMVRRLVEASSLVLVHSQWGADLYRTRYGIRAEVIPQLSLLSESREKQREPADRSITFGIFGGIASYKRLPVALESFIAAHRDYPEIRLIIAGRSDDPATVSQLQDLMDNLSSKDRAAVELLLDPPSESFEAMMGGCDVMVCLRWPTAGETSRVVMRALALGKAVIASDVPQWRELPEESCWRIPIGGPEEVDALCELMVGFASGRISADAAGYAARKYAEENLQPEQVALKLFTYLSMLQEMGPDARSARRPDVVPQRLLGFNTIGAWSTTSSTAEVARRSVLAAFDSGVQVAINAQDIGAPEGEGSFPATLAGLPSGHPFPVDLCYVNLNELGGLGDEYAPGRRQGRRLIACWSWSFPRFPDGLSTAISQLAPDAVLVYSSFFKGVLGLHLDRPIHIVPPVVPVMPDVAVDRLALGIPEQATIYLTCLDADSGFARKNPFGVVEAFRRAFPKPGRGAFLVVKTRYLRRYPEAEEQLRSEVAHVGGQVIDANLSASEFKALLAACDVYVSLHRSDGIGLATLEAMALGKSVVATAYSGSSAFVSRATACPVRYQLVPVEAGDLFLNPGLASASLHTSSREVTLWAEPDLDDAACHLARLHEHADLRTTIGRQGRALIVEHYSPAAHAQALRSVLEMYS